MATAEHPPLGTDDAPRRDRRMSLGQHLTELRKRFIIGLAALVVGMVAAYFLTDWIIWAMTEPIRVVAEQRGEDVGLMIDTVTGAFDLRLRISFAVGIIISAPVWLWQLWAFLMPGLTRKEIRYTIGFVAAAIPLFFAGCFVGWWVMPHIVEIMASFTPDGAANWFQVTSGRRSKWAKVSLPERVFSNSSVTRAISSSFFFSFSQRSGSVRPNRRPRGVNRRSALSWRSNRRYSARLVNIRYGSSTPRMTRSSIMTPIYASSRRNISGPLPAS